jgi:hypothetical protein
MPSCYLILAVNASSRRPTSAGQARRIVILGATPLFHQQLTLFTMRNQHPIHNLSRTTFQLLIKIFHNAALLIQSPQHHVVVIVDVAGIVTVAAALWRIVAVATARC